MLLIVKKLFEHCVRNVENWKCQYSDDIRKFERKGQAEKVLELEEKLRKLNARLPFMHDIKIRNYITEFADSCYAEEPDEDPTCYYLVRDFE